MTRYNLVLLAAFLCMPAMVYGQAVTEPEQEEAQETADATQQAELERQFAANMQDVILRGFYTVKDQEGKPLKEEQYTIHKVTKMRGDYWLFDTRIKYGGHDVRLALPLMVKWAGDTPIITMNEDAVEGMGIFSVRVVIHGDRYAGTWSGGGEHKGHLFGYIEKAPAAEAATEEKKE